MHTLSDSSLRKILIALAIYITSLIAANLMGFKLVPFLFDSHISAGFIMFPIVFLTTDVIGEIYGKRVAKFFVLAGIISTLLWISYSLVSLALPWADKALWVKDSYETMLGVSIRIAIASVIAFAVAEYQDVLSFFFFKSLFGEKMFWLRSLLSNIWSQFLDTVLFMTIAFLSIPSIPFLAQGYELPTLLTLIITWWIYKVAVGFCYTPLSYIGLWLLKEKNEHAGKTN